MIIDTWERFKEQWGGTRNFLMEGECFPIDFDLPPLAELIDGMRRDEAVEITAPTNGGRMGSPRDLRDTFRGLPIDEAMEIPFTMAHFKLDRFDAPGKLLHGLFAQVVEPWQAALRAQGFDFNRCYPIIFISGKGCGSYYHMDFSHVLAWQRYGTKRFYSFRDPERWAPAATRRRFLREHDTYGQWFKPPEAATDSDILCLEQTPGSVLWNVFLTPHWVLGSDDEVSMSINLSHGGLRLGGGPLCPREAELVAWREELKAE